MIEARNISKSFKLYHKPADRLKEIFLRKAFHKHHDALQDLSFKVASGETLGIIGRNGAGKSTLLKILNGVLVPDSGSIHSSGKVTGLLELGTGFDHALSGLQNIRTNGLLLGMSEAEINARRDDILNFAELGTFIEEPLRTYSSGMTMRLAFAIAINARPETFLIDEALSVGDAYFQQKCIRHIKDFRANGGSIIFVSHDLNAVKMICDRALVLDSGQVKLESNPENAVNYYNQLISAEGIVDTPAVNRGYGNRQGEILSAELKGRDSLCNIVTSGEDVTLDVEIIGHENLPAVTLGMVIRDRFGQDIFGTNSHVLGQPFALSRDEVCKLRFTLPMHLSPGKFTISLALHEGIDHTKECYHWWDNAEQFQVTGIRGPLFVGLCNLSPTLERLQ